MHATRIFPASSALNEVLDFAGPADIGGAIANVGDVEEVVRLLKIEGPWFETDGSSASLDAQMRIVLRVPLI